jgi:hypothetical protein
MKPGARVQTSEAEVRFQDQSCDLWFEPGPFSYFLKVKCRYFIDWQIVSLATSHIINLKALIVGNH